MSALGGAEVGDILRHLIDVAPRTRGSALALAVLAQGIATPSTVPLLVEVLERLAATAASPSDGFTASSILADLRKFADHPDVAQALSPWQDVLERLP